MINMNYITFLHLEILIGRGNDVIPIMSTVKIQDSAKSKIEDLVYQSPSPEDHNQRSKI